MLRERITVGTGTDASKTFDGQNMFEAMRLASYLSRIYGFDTDEWISAGEALQLATEGSARLLGFENIGRLATGYEADVVFLRLDRLHFVPLRAPLIQMVFGENGTSVDTVMIGGRIVFRDDRLLTLDEVALRHRAAEAARRLDETGAEVFASGSRVSRLVGVFCAAQSCGMHSGRRKLRCC
jgi:5-methylthioadenosine/S-adenosylhomocysteine deaminase